MTPTEQYGWTCKHAKSADDGPCIACRPGGGYCRRCRVPIDDHEKVGTPEQACPVAA